MGRWSTYVKSISAWTDMVKEFKQKYNKPEEYCGHEEFDDFDEKLPSWIFDHTPDTTPDDHLHTMNEFFLMFDKDFYFAKKLMLTMFLTAPHVFETKASHCPSCLKEKPSFKNFKKGLAMKRVVLDCFLEKLETMAEKNDIDENMYIIMMDYLKRDHNVMSRMEKVYL